MKGNGKIKYTPSLKESSDNMVGNASSLRGSRFLKSQTELWNSVQSLSPEKDDKSVKVKIRPKKRKYHSEEPIDLSLIEDEEGEEGDGVDLKHQEDENYEYLPWYEKYAPNNLSDITIHKRKLKDVETVLNDMLSYSKDYRILLLTGPSGCSKSTLIKHLSQMMVPLYRKPHSNVQLNDDSNSDNISYVIEYENSLQLRGLGNMESFNDFLQRSKFYNSAFNLSVLFVDDLPNVFHYETRLMFQNIIREWLNGEGMRLPPLVICLTECEIENGNDKFTNGSVGININNTYSAETIFTRDILDNPRLKRIKFNPINDTLMKKLLNNITQLEKPLLQKNNKWQQKNEYIKRLIYSGNGDIRSMLSSLQFWATSIQNDNDHNIDNDEIYLRNKSDSFFHGVGKIIYGSRDNDDILRSDTDIIDEMLDISGESNSTLIFNDNFKLGILENYGSFKKGQLPVDVATDVIMALSENDALFGSSNNLEGLEYMMRKVRNKFSQYTTTEDKQRTTGHGKFNFPREWKCRQRQQQFKVEAQDLQNVAFYKYNESLLVEDIISCTGYYSPYIRKKQDYKLKVIQHYMKNVGKKSNDINSLEVDDQIDILTRIGGPFKNDNTLPTTDFKSEDDINNETERTLNALIRNKDERLNELVRMWEMRTIFTNDAIESDFEDEFLDDPLEDSDEEDMNDLLDGDDEDDDLIYEALSQQKPRLQSSPIKDTPRRSETDDDEDDNEEDDILFDELSQQKPRLQSSPVKDGAIFSETANNDNNNDKNKNNDESLSDSDLENLI